MLKDLFSAKKLFLAPTTIPFLLVGAYFGIYSADGQADGEELLFQYTPSPPESDIAPQPSTVSESSRDCAGCAVLRQELAMLRTGLSIVADRTTAIEASSQQHLRFVEKRYLVQDYHNALKLEALEWRLQQRLTHLDERYAELARQCEKLERQLRRDWDLNWALLEGIYKPELFRAAALAEVAKSRAESSNGLPTEGARQG